MRSGDRGDNAQRNRQHMATRGRRRAETANRSPDQASPGTSSRGQRGEALDPWAALHHGLTVPGATRNGQTPQILCVDSNVNTGIQKAGGASISSLTAESVGHEDQTWEVRDGQTGVRRSMTSMKEL